MARKVNTKRYAQAVFQIARETKEFDRWQSDLRKIAGLRDDEVLMAFLENPKFHLDDKAGLVTERLGEINRLALNLVYLLLARGRLSMVGDITQEYEQLLDSHRGIERAEVTTAVPLDDASSAQLSQRLGKLLGKQVILRSKVDPGLIGGMVARVGGKLIDGSTRNRLLALKNEMGGV